ncbi:MAG: hypothetical protein AB4911_15840 [Oscillochloridaceae bacterium umkhey_bin13]
MKRIPWREYGLVLGLALVCAGLILLAQQRSPRLDLIANGTLDAGPAFLDGLYGPEVHPDGYGFRWTSGAALIQLRGAFDAAPSYLAQVRLRAEHPASPQPLSFLLGGQAVATVFPETRFRTYHLLVGPSDQAGRELWVALHTNTFLAPDNPRKLGVILTDAHVRGLAQPNPMLALLAALAVVGVWAMLRLGGADPASALSLAALGSLGLVALAALPRPPVVPPLALAVVVIFVIFGAGLAAQGAMARAALAALGLLVALSGRIWAPWLSDDALISFHYTQNFVLGHGLVYNPGERVEGYTNFLWTIMAVPVIALGGDVVLWAHLSGAIIGVLIVLLSYRLALGLLPGPAWALIASLIIATSQSLLLYTGRGAGLETGLFTLLALLATSRYLSSWATQPLNLTTAGFLFALTALTRPEGVLLFALTTAHLGLWLLFTAQPAPLMARIRVAMPSLLWFAGAFLLIFGPYFAWRVWYYGDLLPNTFYAKTGDDLAQILRGFSYAAGFALTLGGPVLLVVLLPWWRTWRTALASWRGYLLPLVLIYSAYIVAVGGDHFRGERFFVPLLPWIAILIADGLARLDQILAQWRGIRLARLALGLLLSLGVSAALLRTALLDETIQGLDESVWIWRDFGWWLADHTPPSASIAAEAAGAIAFYGQRTTIDMLGLTDRHIGRLEIEGMGQGVAGHEKRDPVYVLDVRQPTYIPRMWEAYFGGSAVLEGPYQLIRVTSRTGRQIELWERVAIGTR